MMMKAESDLAGKFGNVKAKFFELAGLVQTENRCTRLMAERTSRGRGRRARAFAALGREGADVSDRLMQVETLLKELEFAAHAAQEHHA